MIIKCAEKIRGLSLLPNGQGRPFCSANNQMKFLRDRAYLASNIIKRIKSKNNIDELKNLSLSESIIKYLETVKKVEDKARQELLDHFKDGVAYDDKIMTQMRMYQAKIKGQNKIKFYPTQCVTSELFEKFLNNKYEFQRKRIIYTGSFGISKSFSTLLYSKLSNMIAEYNFKNYPKKDYLDENSGIINSPKVIYYNFIPSEIQRFAFGKKIVAQLIPEIDRKDHMNYLNSTIFMKKQYQNSQNACIAQTFNNRNIQVVLFIDQISQYFSMLRKQKEQKIKNRQKMREKIQLFKQQIQQLESQINSIVYFSSMDIQSDLIGQAKLNSQNSILRQQAIPYVQRLNQDEYMSQLIDIFLFCVKQKFSIKRLQKFEKQNRLDNLEQDSFLLTIKQKLLNYLSQIRLQYFLSFLFIRQEVDKKFLDEKNSCSNNEKAVYNKFNAYSSLELQKFIFELFQHTIKKSVFNLETAFSQFLNKRKLNKEFFNTLIFELYFAAQIALRTGTNFYKYEINLTEYSSDKRPQSRLQRSIYKQIFSIKQPDIVRCMVPPTIIVKILAPYIVSTIPYIISQRTDIFNKQMNRSVLGGCAEVFFTKAITSGNKKIELNEFNLEQFISILNLIPKQYRFQQINRSQKDKKNKKYKTNKKNNENEKNQDKLESTQQIISQVRQQQAWERKQFLSSLKHGINQQIENMKKKKQTIRSIVFLPRHKRYVTNQSIIDKIKLARTVPTITKTQLNLLDKSQRLLDSGQISFDEEISHTSKAIDFIIVEINRQELSTNKLQIYAFDMTISQNQERKKMKKFLEEFKTFLDRNKSVIKLGKQKNSQLFTVQLSYFVICPTKRSNTVNYLNEQFGNSFSFAPLDTEHGPTTTYFKVTSKENQENCILKYIGSFDIYSEVKVMNQIPYISGKKEDESLKLWTYFKKKLYQTTEKRKKNQQLIKQLHKTLNKLLGQGQIKYLPKINENSKQQ